MASQRPLLHGQTMLYTTVAIVSGSIAMLSIGMPTVLIMMCSLLVLIPAALWSYLAQLGQSKDSSSGSYQLFLLGSGGHTTEMISMIERGFKPQSRSHRRYLVTAGEDLSRLRITRMEQELAQRFPNVEVGTYDVLEVSRARRVHQSWLTTPLTTVQSIYDIFHILYLQSLFGSSQSCFGFPEVVVTNGPGTGFIICLVAYLLKVVFLAPKTSMKIIFIESWARTNSLSLTGKLFYKTGIADVFIVQWARLAERYNKAHLEEHFVVR